MILNNTPTHEAILSNVGEIGEFRIRNSAKAFSILSSGLYANKIRAIVRELSCNAVDSHTAAGCPQTPFDVHLPTSLEPWFAIRDYGTGLSHDQVTRIYTTYFESTKTGSNDFIGALGLGSKSPFSYTDNFTVTAVQGGVRGIYSAFINGEGVPSIALMTSESTDQPNGVEVKFSVNSPYDYSKFREESQSVYRYFALRPVFNIDFKIKDLEYASRDIVPGVHEYVESYQSVAVMGNIAYRIDVPNASTDLGDLATLLSCGLELHFDIGELDFQASREGLSYIPQTIQAIKSKLQAVNSKLTEKLTAEVDQIPNLWTRAKAIHEFTRRKLWNAAAVQYVTNTGFDLYTPRNGLYGSFTKFELPVAELASKFNITIKGFTVHTGGGSKPVCSLNKESSFRIINTTTNPPETVYTRGWEISADSANCFVVNDTKKGVFERSKHHFKLEHGGKNKGEVVYVLEPAAREKPMLADKFFESIKCPPRVIKASTLAEKERKTISREVTILRLERRDQSYRRNSDDLVWRDAGRSDKFDAGVTHYYIPLSGFVMNSKYKWDSSASYLGNLLHEVTVGDLNRIKVYGVRKADIEAIGTKSNWVNLEDHIVAVIKQHIGVITDTILSKSLDENEFAKYNESTRKVLKYIVCPDSKYGTVVCKIAALKGDHNTYHVRSLQHLVLSYAPDAYSTIMASIDALKAECRECYSHYPLLEMLEHAIDRSSWDVEKFAGYINTVDRETKREQV